MNDLNEATQKICELKGEALGMETMLIALLRAMPIGQLEATLS